MAGLLDWMEKNPALTQGLLGGAFGLLGGRGTRLQAIGQGGMAGLSAYANAKQDETQNRFRDLQTQSLQGQIEQQRMERERQQQLRALPGQFMRSPAQQALAGGGGPTMANAQAMGGAQPQFDMEGYANALMGIDPVQAIQLRQSMKKDTTPIKVGAGDALVDPQTLKPVFTNPKEEAKPEALRALGMIYGEGSPEYRQAAQRYAQKLTTHQPGTNVSINTTKPLLNTMAEKLAAQVDGDLAGAKSAVSTIETAQNVRKLLATGKVLTGPTADARVFALQLGQTLGVAGKDATETLQNTRSVMQGLAQSELDAAAQMKGQGQITESERAILKRAAAGEISFTAPELDSLSKTLEARARKRISVHQDNVKRLGQMPEAAPLVPFYNVDTPPETPGKSEQGQVRRYNPATGRIE